MDHGHVLQIGTPYEIYESPATQFVAQFIGETNLFDAEVVDCVPHKDAKGDDDYMATLSVPELGKQAPLATDTAAEAALDRYMQVTDYDHTDKGQKVAFTIRPEKIRITLEPPHTGGRTDINVFKGIVEEPIYSGFQSKFYVKLETGKIIKVFKQHTDYMDDGPVIHWKDSVYVSWAAEDAYIVEDINK
jgi:spermidine/putrescine transport system ATP-binding protein